ncbi:amidophosphoribosyltransferase [Candidatus Pacearchaeota archaeon]|nr:amidophosphoribosyltransferase [Candidatus Pacearchaeota archaeon]
MKSYGEECGVAAVVIKNPEYKGKASEFLEIMLSNEQHRGQQSAGFVTYDEDEKVKLKRYVGVGRVEDVFKSRDNSAHKKIIDYYAGNRGIGHTRYSTSGASKEYGDFLIEAQPFLRQHGKIWKRFAIAFNGNLANYQELAQELEKNNEYVLDTDVDTELIMHYLSISMKKLEEIGGGKEPNLEEVVKDICKNFDGAYNVVFINGKGKVAAFRDPLGIRPLFYADTKDIFTLASESISLESIGIDLKDIKEVAPGSLLQFDSELKEYRFSDNQKKALCVFEPNYFMAKQSIFKTDSVQSVRRRLGEELTRTEPLLYAILANKSDYIIVPIPDTPTAVAEAMSQILGVPKVEAIIVKHQVILSGRGFIGKPDERERIMKNKYGIIPELIEGKKVIGIEDSFVRGETSKIIACMLKEIGGAKEVHMRSTFPPIISPCFYGIDFPTIKELITSGLDINNIEELEKGVARLIGADSVHYQTKDGLLKALRVSEEECCLACLTGNYPTSFGQKRFEELLNSEK